MRSAVEAHQRGDLDTAERGYRARLAAEPGHPDALNLLGVVLLQRGRPGEAVDLLRRAVAARPADAAFHNNLGEAQRLGGDPAGAERSFAEAVRLAPRYVQALRNLGAIGHARGDLAGAERVARRMLEIAPGDAEAENLLGLVAQARGEHAVAIEAFGRALRSAPGHPAALANLAGSLRAEGRLDDAVATARQLCERVPGEGRAWWLLADTLRAAGDVPGVEQAARRSVELAPRALEPLLVLEWALRGQGRLDESVECLRRAVALVPTRAASHNDLGMSLLATGRAAEAAGCFERAIELDPALAPAWENLARCRRFEPAEARTLADRVEQRLAGEAVEPRVAAHLHFAAARWRDDDGEVAAAVDHYRAANRAARLLRHWDADAHAALVDRLIATFDEALFAGRRSPLSGEERALPLLVVGMPRSGTTLVEQILASHPAVHGGGELNLMAGYIERMPAMLGAPWPECVRSLDDDKAAELARVHVARLRSLGPGASRVTDKMPSNFLHLGLLALMLPGARVACCTRDARDIAVSVLVHHFEGGHAWAYDAGEIARYQADHDRLMAHWRRVLPLDLHGVVYEDLVAAPESGIRELVAWAGLPWHDACLAFHRSGRAVRTASQTQVHEPINARSVGRWRRHAALLEGADAMPVGGTADTGAR